MLIFYMLLVRSMGDLSYLVASYRCSVAAIVLFLTWKLATIVLFLTWKLATIVLFLTWKLAAIVHLVVFISFTNLGNFTRPVHIH